MTTYSNYYSKNTQSGFRLQTQGVEIRHALSNDLMLSPTNFYQTPCSAYEGDNSIWRAATNELSTTTIYNDPNTDQTLKAALAQRVMMEGVSSLIGDEDRKLLSWFCQAITRGDIVMLAQLFCALSESAPQKLPAFAQTLNQTLSDLAAGVLLTMISPDQFLLHQYHGNCAIAIKPLTKSVTLVPISTDWDGTVSVEEGEIVSPTVEELSQKISAQAVCRILLKYETESSDEDRIQVSVVEELAA